MNPKKHQNLLGASLICLFMAAFSTFALANHGDLEKSLSSELKSKVVILRGVYTEEFLHFDSSGILRSDSTTGYWSSDAMLQVKKVRVEGSELQISGNRVVSVFDLKAGQFKNKGTDHKVALTIDIDPTWQDPGAQLRNVLGKIFAASTRELASQEPSYWGCWLSGTIEPREKGGWKCSPSDIPKKTADGAGYEPVVAGVTPPKALKDDDPAYPRLARAARIEGSTVLWAIIDEHGLVSDVRISRPLGAGMDDAAVEKVRTWRFAPAVKDGHPVRVAVSIEVSFHLY